MLFNVEMNISWPILKSLTGSRGVNTKLDVIIIILSHIFFNFLKLKSPVVHYIVVIVQTLLFSTGKCNKISKEREPTIREEIKNS